MSGRIPPEFIDNLIARTDIVALIGARLQLRRAGKDYQARCPFHDEKTPSFTVSPDKQFYHCFGCGAHGTAIGFLMDHDRLPFREAVAELASLAGLELPADDRPAQDAARPAGPDPARLHALNERAAALYRQQLREHAEAARAVDYLKGRGLSGEIAARYGLGFAPPGGDFLLTRLGATSADRALLSLGGLIAERDGRLYDRFRDRIVFPIRDRRGRVLGFGGRLLGEGKPKYLNSPETPVFHKGRELYGLHEALQAERNPAALLVVEGYLDVIALAQFGFANALATLGTATTREHLQLLARLAPRLDFCFDGDRAGRAAAWKAVETALPLATGHQSIRFLFLPEGEDPDSLVRREGAEGLRARLATARTLSDVLFDHLSARVDMTTSDGRAQLATLARPYLEQVPAGAYRDMLFQRLAALSGLPANGGGGRSSSGAARRGLAGRVRQPGRPSRIAQAIGLLLDQPSLAADIAELDDNWRRLPGPGTEILIRLLDAIAAQPGISKAALLERWRDHAHFDYLQRLSVDPFLRDIPEAGHAAEFAGALNRLNEDARRLEQRRPLNRQRPSDWDAEERARLEREAERARNRRRQ